MQCHKQQSISIILTTHPENLFVIYLVSPNSCISLLPFRLLKKTLKYCVDLKYSKHNWKHLATAMDLHHYWSP